MSENYRDCRSVWGSWITHRPQTAEPKNPTDVGSGFGFLGFRVWVLESMRLLTARGVPARTIQNNAAAEGRDGQLSSNARKVVRAVLIGLGQIPGVCLRLHSAFSVLVSFSGLRILAFVCRSPSRSVPCPPPLLRTVSREKRPLTRRLQRSIVTPDGLWEWSVVRFLWTEIGSCRLCCRSQHSTRLTLTALGVR